MKTFTGTVVSVKTAKTAVIEVVSQMKHPLYKKIISSTKRLKAHYEEGEIKEGTSVVIAETRPISKTKFFRIIKVIK
jgi:small subunit ribosomal protein S17